MNKEEVSNIITPPDFIDSKNHTVTIIDPTWLELEDLAMFFKTASESFTAYIYREEMNNEEWLREAINRSEAVIINSIHNDLSQTKDKLAANLGNQYYYGNKTYLLNHNRIEAPVDYFVQYLRLDK